MILYNPLSGDANHSPILRRPRTCFLITKLGNPSATVRAARKVIETAFGKRGYNVIDAESVATGKDFLLKIWRLIVGVPICIAIVDEGMTAGTIANIFYELGYADSLGKETLVIKTNGFKVPSDFVRTEYIALGKGFKSRLNCFLQNLGERVTYYASCAQALEKDPLLSIDYYRRAFLLSGDRTYSEKTAELLLSPDLKVRAISSMKMLLAGFATDHSAETTKLAEV